MLVEQTLSSWRADPSVGDNFTAWESQPARQARYAAFPPDLHPALRKALVGRGVGNLYVHQRAVWDHAIQGENVVVVTGTASGKTLCYNLPVMHTLFNSPNARALYIFPTKALTQDQLTVAHTLAKTAGKLEAVDPRIYDGDTPSAARSAIRRSSHLVFTNPDMLHMGILPHHTLWADFFHNLRYVVIDEVHIYRGVFGSHVANVLRRLQRVAHFYGSHPQFILTSATIANPIELAERLVETPVMCVDEDGSPRGPRHFLLYNPPVTNRELGIRRSALLESVRLASELVDRGIQTIIFARARRTVEMILTYLRQKQIEQPDSIRGYRSGYLPLDRREIEAGLREGRVRAVVATNALELGIDIGGLGASILVGYPGTIASTHQQAGRAGRSTDSALAVMIASPDALDQFLVRHPEYLFKRSPEQALIQPDNLLILLHHIRCAAFELPFKESDGFGKVDPALVREFLEVLETSGVLHHSAGRYYWMADQYPANQISLRTASAEAVLLQVEGETGLVTIGQVDYESSLWMVHPGALYLHEAQSYLVDNLDLEHRTALLKPTMPDYYTEPLKSSTVERLAVLKKEPAQGCSRTYGELVVTNQVIGFRKVSWLTHENLGVGPLDLPSIRLTTTGYWITLNDQTVEKLQAENLWTNDSNNYGPNWPAIRLRVLARDNHRCQVCGALEIDRPHHVHHKVPFRQFVSSEAANQLDNLVTLCPICHKRAEAAVSMRTGLSGLAYVVGHLAPLFVMCDLYDLGVHADPQSPLSEGKPAVCIYDNIPAGIGLSERLFELHPELLRRARETVATCDCTDGCPSCVGPAGEAGAGGKRETLAILVYLTDKESSGLNNPI